jgi:hypothetical protein
VLFRSSAQWKTRADEIGLIYDRLQATVRDKAALPKRIEETREVFGNELVDKITEPSAKIARQNSMLTC